MGCIDFKCLMCGYEEFGVNIKVCPVCGEKYFVSHTIDEDGCDNDEGDAQDE